jgi:hypothetical protein
MRRGKVVDACKEVVDAEKDALTTHSAVLDVIGELLRQESIPSSEW